MRVLVTGATGRVGSRLVPALLTAGHTVRALIIPDDPFADRIPSGLETIIGDIQDAEVAAAAVNGTDAVVHLAAVQPFFIMQPNSEFFENNIRGTFNLLESAVKAGSAFKRFVFASTGQIYPDLKPAYVPIDEFHPIRPDDFYGFSKFVCEHMLSYYYRVYQLPVTTARFAPIMEGREIVDPNGWGGGLFFVNGRLRRLQGRNDGSPETAEAIAILLALKKDEEQLLISYELGGRPYELGICDPRDIVQGLMLMLTEEAAINDVFQIGPPCSFTFDQGVKLISKLTGFPYVEARFPGIPYHFSHSIAKARAHLGYNPTWDPFKMMEEGVSELKKEGKLGTT